MSASSVWVTWGTLTQEACRRGPEMRLMRESGTVSMGPNFAKSTAGTAGSAPPPAATATAPPASAALTSSRVMRPCSPVPLILLRSKSSSRASRRTAGPANTPEKSGFAGPDPATGAGAGGVGAAGSVAGCAWGGAASAFTGVGEGAAAAPSASTRAMMAPIDTLSPTFVRTSATSPATGDGTSIVALSDSRVISDWSTLTMSPGFTSTSMTGTSLKSPISGTLTSIFPTGAPSFARGERNSSLSFAPEWTGSCRPV